MLVISIALLTAFPMQQALPNPDIRWSESSNEAVLLALADVKAIPPVHRPFMRYVWTRSTQAADLRSQRTASLALNFDSLSHFIAVPPLIVKGSTRLLRVDLRNYDPELKTWPKAWEELSFDPSFSLLVTKDFATFSAVDFAAVYGARFGLRRKGDGTAEEVEEIVVDHPGGVYKYPAGTWGVDAGGNVVHEWTFEAGRRTVSLHRQSRAGTIPVTREWLGKQFGKVDLIRFNAPDVDQAAFLELQFLTGSLAPVVEGGYMKYRICRSIEEDGLFRDAFGGLYVRFKGFRKGQGGATDLDLFLEDVGAVGKGEKLKDRLARLSGDMRAAMQKSLVTGKKRVVMIDGDVAITFDVKDKDVDLGQQATAVLDDPFRFVQAYEVIYQGRNGIGGNGLPVVDLFNNQQVRQEEAPSGQGGIVDDTTVPNPHTHRLDKVDSCLRCHGGKFDFWQPIQNDVPKIYALELDRNTNDLNQFLQPNNNLRLRLVGQFTGDGIPRFLARKRLDYQQAVRQAVETGVGSVWEGSKEPGWTDVGRLASDHLGGEVNNWGYVPVTAEDALRDIGIVLTDKKDETAEARNVRAAGVFNRMVPVTVITNVSGLTTEDSTVKALRAGLSVSRFDWAFRRGFVAGSVRPAKMAS